jgi:hypothetical protein
MSKVTYRLRGAHSGWYWPANGVVISPYFATKKKAVDWYIQYRKTKR